MSNEARILDVFLAIREDKDAHYDKTDFLEFLIRPNGKRLDDRFKGKRYKTRFVHAVQSEFTICFPNDFYEKHWDLDELAAYIDERSVNANANLSMARTRYERSKKTDIGFILIANLILMAPLSAIATPYVWLYTLVPLSFNLLMLRFKWCDIAYHRQLLQRIEQASAESHRLKRTG